MVDREWKKAANPDAWKAMERYEAQEHSMMEKKRKAKLLQYHEIER